MTPDVLIAALSLDAWERHWGSEANARRAWRALADDRVLAGNSGSRPAPFWGYVEDVPDELRGGGTIEDANNRELEYRRVRWLLSEGKHHQRTDEGPVLYGLLEGLESELEAP